MSFRMDRVNGEIKRRIMEIVHEDLDDPHCAFISITHVVTSRDLRESKIYFSALKDAELPHIEQSLNKMSGFIRKRLGGKMRIKILPVLSFIPDTSIKYSVEINKKIEEVCGDQKNPSGDQGE